MGKQERIESFLYNNFPEVKIANGEDEFHFNSPFYSDSKMRLYVNSKTGYWFDQKLQSGGKRFEGFIKEYLDIEFKDAVELLEKEYSPLAFAEKKEEEKKEIVSDLSEFKHFKEIIVKEDGSYKAVESRAIRYLISRGINPLGLFYCDKKDNKFFNRIIIPFYEEGEVTYFIARSLDSNNKMRYLNPKGLKSADKIFNFDKIEEEVFIFEGVFDALSLNEQVGTAILTNLIREGQVDKILKKEKLKRIIFVPDKDEDPKIRLLIMKNLKRGIDLIKSRKAYKREMEFYIYNLPEGYNDFNDYSVSEKVNKIELKDCEKYDETKFLSKIMMLSITN